MRKTDRINRKRIRHSCSADYEPAKGFYPRNDYECSLARRCIFLFSNVTLNGIEYFRTRIEDADGKRVALYAKTAEELYEKVEEAKRQIEEASFRRAKPLHSRS